VTDLILAAIEALVLDGVFHPDSRAEYTELYQILKEYEKNRGELPGRKDGNPQTVAIGSEPETPGSVTYGPDILWQTRGTDSINPQGDMQWSPTTSCRTRVRRNGHHNWWTISGPTTSLRDLAGAEASCRVETGWKTRVLFCFFGR